jgi:hypothetical protein
LPDILEHPASRLVPLMHRGPPHRIGQLAPRAPGEETERDRHIGRAERGRGGLADVAAGQRGEQCEAGDIAGLALVDAHAQGRVALQMLARDKAFARRQRDIGGSHVVVQIDESALAAIRQRQQRQMAGRGFLVPRD